MDASQLTRFEDVDQTARCAGELDLAAVVPTAGEQGGWVEVARREAWQLPVLRQGRVPRRLPETWEGVHLRLQAALWEVAAKADIPVSPGSSVDAVARLLVGYGAIIPPAGDGVRALAAIAESACSGREARGGLAVDEGARLAERLAGYLALRARFG